MKFLPRIFVLILALLSALGVVRAQDLGKVSTVRTAPTTAGLTCDPNLGHIVYNLSNKRLYRCSATNTWSPISHSQYFDPVDYRAHPSAWNLQQEYTTATATAGSGAITLAAAKSFANGEGGMLYNAGNVATMAAPAAPTVTSPVLGGSKTFHYQCVAADQLDGLVPGAVATLASAPDLFAPQFVRMSSASVTSNVLTINFNGAINAAAGNEIDVRGLTGSGANWNGLYKVATAPSTTQVTIALTTANGTATVGSTSQARLTNARNITAISRSGNTITITTDAPHNWKAQTGGVHNTLITVANVVPADLNGTFIVLTATGSTITASSAIYATETGGVVPGSSAAYVEEFVTVTCPDPAAGTFQYYVYGDSRDGGVTMTYLGATLPSQKTFTDWGPFKASGQAQGWAVPTVPPVAATHDNLPVIISSGAGTLNLVVSPVVPTTGSFTFVHDQTPAVQAAINAASGLNGGVVYLSPDNTATSRYVFNSPLYLWQRVDLVVGATLIVNSTININPFLNAGCAGGARILGVAGPNNSGNAFAAQAYPIITGSAKVFILANQGCALTLDNLEFNSSANGQNFIQLQSTMYTQFSHLSFDDNANSNTGGTNVGITEVGAGSSMIWSDFNSTAYSGAGQGGVPSNGPLTYGTPLIPMFWFRGCDFVYSGCQPGIASSFVLSGRNTINGRGFLFDRTFAAGGQNFDYQFLSDWDQAASTPYVSIYGNIGFAGGPFRIDHTMMDTSPLAIFGNFTNNTQGPLIMSENTSSAWPYGAGFGTMITGNPLPLIVAYGSQTGGVDNIGQNFSVLMPWSNASGGNTIYGGGSNAPQAYSGNYTMWGLPLHFSPAIFNESTTITDLASTGIAAGGAVPVGTHTWCVAPVAWNGAWGVCGNSVTLTTTTGNQTVPFTWSRVDGAAGYQLFRDTVPCGTNTSIGQSLEYTTNLLTFTDTFQFCNNSGHAPTVSGYGLPQIDGYGVMGKQLSVVNGQKIATFDVDLLSNVRVDGAVLNIPTARDNFNRANGALGSNWTTAITAPAIAGNAVNGGSTSQINVAYWTGAGAFPANLPQSASVEIASTRINVGTVYMGPGLYIASGLNGYFCFASDTQPALSIWKYVGVTNGFGGPPSTTGASLIVNASPYRQIKIGDLIQFSAAPNADKTEVTLTCSVPGLMTISGTDTASPLMTGAPGFAIYNADGLQQIDNWKAWTPVRTALSASLSTTAATSDVVTIPGMLSSYRCQLTPTNASAATNIATTYISSKSTPDQITVAHTAMGSMTYDITCSP
jgi:hypothetical protein